MLERTSLQSLLGQRISCVLEGDKNEGRHIVVLNADLEVLFTIDPYDNTIYAADGNMFKEMNHGD